ncbi:hypothetical protein B566_EDAN003667 [Ephemera danica]|nr:hypothetical protein B566_EDAN003667 [Ephemera danica]
MSFESFDIVMFKGIHVRFCWCLQPGSYGKKSGAWYAGGGGGGSRADMTTPLPTVGTGKYPAGGGWRGSKKNLAPPDSPPPAPVGGKGSSGRIIRIVNSSDHTVQCRVLLNLRTTQPFEEVLEDLGQVLKMGGAKRMFTLAGQEPRRSYRQVRSFSQLRNEFAEVETFYLSNAPVRRSRTLTNSVPLGAGGFNTLEDRDTKRRSRSHSRQRVYNSEPDLRGAGGVGGGGAGPVAATVGPDYTVVDIGREPARVTIRGNKRVFFPPLHHAPFDPSPPDRRYGYRGSDTRRNLWVLPTGELLYFVAAVAVLFDRDEESQRHYTGHTEDIQCMDLHPSREMVASGQRAGRNRKTQAHVRIWSPETLLTLYVFGMGEFDIGVSAVAFSQLNGGSYVLAVDGGRERILSVWQWQWGHLLGKVATLQDEMCGASFHPLDDNLVITHGKGHLAFWTRRKDGFFERTDLVKAPARSNITCLQFEPDGDVVTGDSDGFITVYSVDSEGAYFVRLEYEAHNKAIGSLIMLSEGTLLSGGEKDRRLIAWDTLQNYKKIAETKLPESAGGVRSIYPQRPGRNDGNVFVGTTRNNIVEGSLQRRFNQVVFGHSRQLWGLACHPDEELFATAGHDKFVALWRRHGLLWNTQTTQECVSLAFHPDAVVVAAGTSDGHLVVLNAENGNPVTRFRVCGSSINCVAFSPVGDMIALGSQNGSVYLFRVSRDGFSYKKHNKIRGGQALTALDWSVDGNFLQSASADYDLIYWDIKTMTSEKSPLSMKDVKWFTHTCALGFLVSGLWNNRYYPMSSIVTTAHRAGAHDLLVSGDADGFLRLFSNHIATARFLQLDRSVVTVGGSDAALMLWDVVDD